MRTGTHRPATSSWNDEIELYKGKGLTTDFDFVCEFCICVILQDSTSSELR